jgi:hypothetical protein
MLIWNPQVSGRGPLHIHRQIGANLRDDSLKGSNHLLVTRRASLATR